MEVLGRWLAKLRMASRSPRLVLLGALAAAVTAAVTLGSALYSPTIELRVSAGSEAGRRHEIAEVLAELAERRGISIVIEPTAGSAASLRRVNERQLDVALVQGGLHAGRNVREVAPLDLEPLHLLVRDPEITSVVDLRGRTLDLGTPGSGTRELALELLTLVGMRTERDFTELSFTYEELLSKPEDQLPDAVFTVSTLPSPVAERLVRRRGYRLIPLPFAGALRLRDIGILEAEIPPYTYGAAPAHPPETLPTIATRMIVVAHRETPDEAVKALLEVLASDEFEREADLTPAHHDVLGQPEIRMHPGALEWIQRNDPLVTPELIDNVESLRSFLVSIVVALILAWRWLRARQLQGFEKYLHDVTDLEKEVLELELAADLNLPRLLRIQRELSSLKNRALDGYGQGQIATAELLNSFLAHVNDVRVYLNALILHERERLEKKARRTGEREDDVRRELWLGAVGELGDDD